MWNIKGFCGIVPFERLLLERTLELNKDEREVTIKYLYLSVYVSNIKGS